MLDGKALFLDKGFVFFLNLSHITNLSVNVSVYRNSSVANLIALCVLNFYL